MARKTKKNNRSSAWLALDQVIKNEVPHLAAVLADEEDFISFHIKMRDDGSVIGVLKRFGSDGGKLVCFGSSYTVSGCFVAVDATIQGGNWKVDKPWNGSGSSE